MNGCMAVIDRSINKLQRLFKNCEREVQWLDLRTNVNKNHAVCPLVLDLLLPVVA